VTQHKLTRYHRLSITRGMMATTDGHATWHVTISTLITVMYMDRLIQTKNGRKRSTFV
jgi:hypothetical protein